MKKKPLQKSLRSLGSLRSLKPLRSLKSLVSLVSLVALSLLFPSCSSPSADRPLTKAPQLNSAVDSLSWAYGQNIADALHRGFFNELDADLVLQSARYTLAGGTDQPMNPQEVMDALNYIMAMYAASSQQAASQTQQNVEAAQAEYFKKLEKENPNVKRHPQGFYYEVLRPGKGPKAQYAKRINFDYRSFLLLTGEPYDQTYGKRDPIVHVVGEPMFPGLIHAFQLMNAGSIYRFYFPYQLAFGAKGSGEIPPFTPFIYEIELHEIYND